MRFWDTSGVVPLLLTQETTREVEALLDSDPTMVAWWGTPVECASAAARLRREGLLSVHDESVVLESIDRLQAGWLEILPSNEVRVEARRILRVHPLRAGDALQLAAALVWAGSRRDGDIVTLDERFALAARLEGLGVVP